VQIDTTVLDVVIALSAMFMAVSLLLFVSAACGVLYKGRDTLTAIERLADTLQQEVGPTAVQLRDVMDGINQIKGVTTQRITAVTHKVETAADSVATVVDQTKKQSSVWSAGVFAGFREYLYGKQDTSVDKQLSMDKGERRELKQ
jgi:uncharacterized protein YoxC